MSGSALQIYLATVSLCTAASAALADAPLYVSV